MGTRDRRRGVGTLISAVVLLPCLPACLSPGDRAKLVKENEALRRDREHLDRTVAQRDQTIAALHRQVGDLQGFGSDRPVDLFSPVTLEIASLSGGADYDDRPGDDGVTVYLRPRDADGDAVKVPGRITIQLVDNTTLGSPRVVGLYVFSDLHETRNMWHGKFGTQHFTLKCPFPPGVELPENQRLLVSAEFVDLLTGATLAATQEVGFARASP